MGCLVALVFWGACVFLALRGMKTGDVTAWAAFLAIVCSNWMVKAQSRKRLRPAPWVMKMLKKLG